MEHEYYYQHNTRKRKLGYVSYGVCNKTDRLLNGLTHLLLDPFFKPYDEHCPKSSCKVCQCSTYSSNVIGIVTYLSIDMTKIVASTMIVDGFHGGISICVFRTRTLS